MVRVNGFNSDNYRYFRNKSDGTLKKYTAEMLKKSLFNWNFTNSLNEERRYQMVEFPKDKPFDLVEYIKMQPPIVLTNDGELEFTLDKDEFFFITDWLAERLFSDEIPTWRLLFSCESYKERNMQKLNMIESDEVLAINDKSTSDSMSIIPFSKSIIQPKIAFKFTHGIKFAMPYKKGEVWSFDNPAILFLFLNQSFLKDMCQSEEILETEKDQIFLDEYKDNIPGTTIKYYRIKDEFKFDNLRQLASDIPCSKDKYNGYCSTYINWYASLKVCKYNPNNYNEDGSIKYFSVEFPDTDKDRIIEEELAKIAERLPQEEAIERFNEDQASYAHHKKEQEAEEYVRKHRKRYMKGANRTMTPIEFMEQEKARIERDHEKILAKKLTPESSNNK